MRMVRFKCIVLFLLSNISVSLGIYENEGKQIQKILQPGSVVHIITHKDEGVRGVVNPVTGLLDGNRIAESVVRDLQFVLSVRITLEVVQGVDSTSKDYFSHAVVEPLNEGRAMLAIGYYYVTQSRILQATPLIPILTDKLVAMFLQPPSASVRNIYLSPLQFKVVFIFFTLVSLTTILPMVWLLWITPKRLWNQDNINLSHTLVIIVSITTRIDCHYNHYMSHVGGIGALRLFTLCGTFLSLVIYSIYSAKLISVILMPVEKPIRRVEDLIDAHFSFYTIPAAEEIVHKNVLMRKAIQRKPPPLAKPYYHMKMTPWLDSFLAALNGHHAHIDVSIESVNGFRWFKRLRELYSVPQSDTEICSKLSSVEVLHSNIFLSTAFYIAKNSSSRNILNRSILQIKTSGLLHRYCNKREKDQMNCNIVKVVSRYEDHLGLTEVSSAFLFFFSFAAASLIILGIEQLYSANIMASLD